jgi:hypothetical protein
MKYLFILLPMMLLSIGVFAQVNTDSVAYSRQRSKINAMLAARKTKFSQYDSSLNKHTGIFGMETKNDIRRSNEILMDIVDTDDEIFTKLKTLFDYRTSQLNYTSFQNKQVEKNAQEIEKTRVAYMNTINRFRNENEALNKRLLQQTAEAEKKQRLYLIVFVFMFASILVLLVLYRKRKV